MVCASAEDFERCLDCEVGGFDRRLLWVAPDEFCLQRRPLVVLVGEREIATRDAGGDAGLHEGANAHTAEFEGERQERAIITHEARAVHGRYGTCHDENRRRRDFIARHELCFRRFERRSDTLLEYIVVGADRLSAHAGECERVAFVEDRREGAKHPFGLLWRSASGEGRQLDGIGTNAAAQGIDE